MATPSLARGGHRTPGRASLALLKGCMGCKRGQGRRGVAAHGLGELLRMGWGSCCAWGPLPPRPPPSHAPKTSPNHRPFGPGTIPTAPLAVSSMRPSNHNTKPHNRGL
ncbi:hypothetical protein COCOBI_pt-2230 (chloroplast) [Coccomyxa sp. Obi]|nr:hypothetical protein COCOBI_pt-2230 [Coccomyxa sp. Obi]